MITSNPMDTVNMSTRTESEAVSLDSIPLYNIANLLWLVWPPAIFLIGSFGNVMTLVIMYRKTSSNKDSSTFPLFITSLAIADLITIAVLVLPEWIGEVFQYHFVDLHSAVCKVLRWLQLFARAAACWYLVLLSLHRAVSVVWPHRVNLVCTRRLVLVLLSTITVFLAALFSPYIYGYDLLDSSLDSSSRCMMKDTSDTDFNMDVIVYMEQIVYSLLPFVCLVLANGVLVWKLTTSVRQANQRLTTGTTEQTRARDKAAKSVTLTVLFVSLTFLILTLPSSVYVMMFYVGQYFNKVSGHEYVKVYFFSTVAFNMADSNSAVNFYLYCLTGRRFREEFLKVLLCWKKGAGKERETDQPIPGFSSKTTVLV